MPLTEREQIHHQLLQALGNARKQVERLEAALAHNAAFLGTGVEREDQFGKNPDFEIAPDALIRYLELVVPEADISDYIGSEGHDATRPRLGEDAPDAVRPKERRVAKSIVRLLAEAHPDDGLPFPAATVTLGSENSPQKQSGPSDPTPPEEGAFAAGPLPKTIPPPAGPLSQTQNRPAALSQNNGLSASPRSDPLVNPASEDGAGYSYLLEGSRIFFNGLY